MFRRVAASAPSRLRVPVVGPTSGLFAARWQASPPPQNAGKAAAFTDPDMTHFRNTSTPHPLYPKPAKASEWPNPMGAHVWTKEEVLGVQQTHVPTKDVVDMIAYGAVKLLRLGFDLISGYFYGRLTRNKILRRVLFLETAAGIPGMVAGSIRHLQSLRWMQRDHGWIHTLLEEAENERMHMLVFMHRHKPGLFFRGAVVVTQALFWNIFFVTYMACPRLCHRFVGYLEEEATRTYSHIIEVMESKDPRDAEVVAFGKSPADQIAIRYWGLEPTATMLDVMLAVRRDEANHRDVNHTFACLKRNATNPHMVGADDLTSATPERAGSTKKGGNDNNSSTGGAQAA